MLILLNTPYAQTYPYETSPFQPLDDWCKPASLPCNKSNQHACCNIRKGHTYLIRRLVSSFYK